MAYDINALIGQLQHRTGRNWKARQEAAYKLGKARHPSGIPALSEALRSDESIYVRMAAATALGQIEHPDGVPALIDALDDGYYLVRQTAMWALGSIGYGAEAALPRLEALTTSTERYDQAELTVAEIARLVLTRIDAAIAAGPKQVAAAATAPAGAAASAPAPTGSFVERMRARARLARDVAHGLAPASALNEPITLPEAASSGSSDAPTTVAAPAVVLADTPAAAEQGSFVERMRARAKAARDKAHGLT